MKSILMKGDTVSPNIIIASLIDASSLDLYVEVRSDVIEGLKIKYGNRGIIKRYIIKRQINFFSNKPKS